MFRKIKTSHIKFKQQIHFYYSFIITISLTFLCCLTILNHTNKSVIFNFNAHWSSNSFLQFITFKYSRTNFQNTVSSISSEWIIEHDSYLPDKLITIDYGNYIALCLFKLSIPCTIYKMVSYQVTS